MTSKRRVLVPIDFSAGSDEALTQAIALAKQTNAELELVYVLEAGVDVLQSGLAVLGLDQVGPGVRGERGLASRAARVRAEGVVCRTVILEGKVPTQVIQRAREIGAELVVVGTHGRTGLSHVLLGSVAERIVQRSICPVLTVRYSKKAA